MRLVTLALLALLLERALELPHPHPAALAGPQGILQRGDEDDQESGEDLHLIW